MICTENIIDIYELKAPQTNYFQDTGKKFGPIKIKYANTPISFEAGKRIKI